MPNQYLTPKHNMSLWIRLDSNDAVNHQPVDCARCLETQFHHHVESKFQYFPVSPYTYLTLEAVCLYASFGYLIVTW